MRPPQPFSERRARVLLLITELQMGGAARVVRDLADMLSPRFDVTEAVFNQKDGVDFAGRQVASLDVTGGGGPFGKLMNLARRVRRTRLLKDRVAADVTISHLEGAHWVDILSGGSGKSVLCVHGTIRHNRDIRGVSGFARKHLIAPIIYKRADRIVTVSRDLEAEMASFGVPPERIRTINNSFDLEKIAAQSRARLSTAENALFEGVPVLITAGRLAEQKNQQPLIDIFADLARSRPLRLLILGDGPLRNGLLAHARGAGLRVWDAWSEEPLSADRQVYFLGVQENPFRWLGRAELFLFPSSWEGFPLALCEAMICGVPVLSTDCRTGPREILAPETSFPDDPLLSAEPAPFGMLMPLLHDPVTLGRSRRVWVEAISQLLDDRVERQRMAGAARQRVQDFSREKIAGQWIALVEELLTTSR